MKIKMEIKLEIKSRVRQVRKRFINDQGLPSLLLYSFYMEISLPD